jgi:hypothetical protein
MVVAVAGRVLGLNAEEKGRREVLHARDAGLPERVGDVVVVEVPVEVDD